MFTIFSFLKLMTSCSNCLGMSGTLDLGSKGKVRKVSKFLENFQDRRKVGEILLNTDPEIVVGKMIVIGWRRALC